jgi:hypothetical protein
MIAISEKGVLEMTPKNAFQFFVRHFFTNNALLVFISLFVLVVMISGFGR